MNFAPGEFGEFGGELGRRPMVSPDPSPDGGEEVVGGFRIGGAFHSRRKY
jgi:hypothetical protein